MANWKFAQVCKHSKNVQIMTFWLNYIFGRKQMVVFFCKCLEVCKIQIGPGPFVEFYTV